MTPDGRRVLACVGLTVAVWEAETGVLVAEVSHARHVESVSITSDSKLALSTSPAPPGEVQLWQIDDGKVLRRFHEAGDSVRCAQLLPDGRHFVSLALSEEGGLRLWEIESGRQLAHAGPRDSDLTLAVDPVGKFVVSAGGVFWRENAYRAGEDLVLHVWRLPDLSPITADGTMPPDD